MSCATVCPQDDEKDIAGGNTSKFHKMVTMSQKLYSSEAFKGKDDRSKRRKLVARLRGLYQDTNISETFAEAVVKAGWLDFQQWLRETNTIKLDSDDDQKKLTEILDSKKEVNWSFVDGPDLHQTTLNSLVALTSSLMKTFYDASPNLGPWNSAKMVEELSHEKSHCLILRSDKDDEFIGYVCFRIEANIISVQEEYLEFYVYELMIKDSYQRKGYGELLMNACEHIATCKLCDYIELTVFTSNTAAMKFYRKGMHYEFDKGELDEYKHDYRILTKIL